MTDTFPFEIIANNTNDAIVAKVNIEARAAAEPKLLRTTSV
jgi:hypothetical protein